MRTGFLFFLFLLPGLIPGYIPVSARDTISFRLPENITLSYHHGYLVPHHKMVSYFISDYIDGFDLTLSKYLGEVKPDNPPQIGGGYYFSNLGSKEIFGYTHGLYFYIARDFLKNRSPICFQSTILTGASYNTIRSGIREDYFNHFIGSHLNIFFMYSVNLKVKLNRKIVLSAGPALVHTSNGNIRQPNFGLNLLTTRVSLTYAPDCKRKDRIRTAIAYTVPGKNHCLFILSGGWKQLSNRIPDYYPTGSFVAEYLRNVSPWLNLGLGSDLFYDPAEGREVYVTGSRQDVIVPWSVGAHFSLERQWDHLSLFLSPGYIFYAPMHQSSYQYNRVGIRYRFNNHLVINYSLKSHSIVADFLEFGIGYIL